MIIGAPTLLSAATVGLEKLNILTVTQIGVSPYVSSWIDDNLKLPDLVPALANAGWNAAWSPDGSRLAIAVNATSFLLYRLSDGLLVLDQEFEFGGRPAHISWSPNSEYICVSYQVIMPGIRIYRKQGGEYELYTTIDSGTNYTKTCWNSNGTMLFAISSSSPVIVYWAVSGGVFLKQNTLPNLPTQTVFSISISGDNSILAVGLSNSPTMILYQISNPPVRLPNPDLGGVDNNYGVVQFHGNKLAFMNGINPTFRIYSLSGTSLSLLGTWTNFPINTAADYIEWNAHGDRIALASPISPFLFLFNWNGSIITQKAMPPNFTESRIRQLSYGLVKY